MEWMITSFFVLLYVALSMHSFVSLKKKRIQLPMFYIIFPICLPFLGYIMLWGLNLSLNKEETDISLDQKDPDEWFEVDDTQKMSRVESAYNHVEEVIPLEEALVLKDKEVSRWMLMEIVSRAPAKFIDLLFLARQNDDTEVVHYATTLIAEISRQYDIRLQALEKKHQDNPTDYRVLAEYCAVLEAYLQKDLVTKRMGELLRKDYSNLLEKKLHQKEQLSDYIKLIENDFLLKRYERVKEYLDFVSQKWPHQEAIYMLYLRYYFETRQGERLEELVETIQSGSIYLSKENRERLAFWQS